MMTVYSCILHFIHFLCTVILLVKSLLDALYDKWCLWINWVLGCVLKRRQLRRESQIQHERSVYAQKSSLVYIKHVTKSFLKKPTHISFVIVEDKISFKDLALLFSWCVAAGISFVSFYDHHGKLKREREILTKLCKDASLDLHSTDDGIGSEDSSSSVQLSIMSREDGRNTFACVAQELCRNVAKGILDVSEVDQTEVSKALAEKIDIPDPELLLCCGPTYSTLGFLPWHIRLTEMLWLRTHHNIKVKDFLHALEEYNMCDQKLGK